MSSLSDILTATKNIVTAINGAAQTYLNVQGVRNCAEISSATLVVSGPSRVAVVSVTTAGVVGAIYDTNSASSTSNLIYVIPATVGVVNVNIPVSYGIVVAPGSGQVVTISYA